MKISPEHLIYESAHKGNILPLTSACNVRCIFCSHPQNPPEVEVYRINNRTVSQVEDTLQFIDPTSKIVIGESVTRIIEGEPLTHPQIKEILSLIRNRFPKTTIQITTNGTLLDDRMVDFLAGIGRIELNLSLNSSSFTIRQRLMRDRYSQTAVQSPAILAKAGIAYHGSIVAMPHVNGWADLRETIIYLSDYNARTIRVFLPGFTSLAPDSLKFSPELRDKLSRYINELNNKIDVPVIFEPPLLTNLDAVVRGVIKGSPAYKAGFAKNDVILSVNENSCFSRADAFQKIKNADMAKVQIKRENDTLYLEITKKRNEPSGLVMEFDIDKETIEYIGKRAQKYDNPYIFCSEFGEPVIKQGLSAAGLDRITTIVVQSKFFGGSIACAGLLTVCDFINTVEQIKFLGYTLPDVCIIPAVTFDNRGKDLTGETYYRIKEVTGIEVEII